VTNETATPALASRCGRTLGSFLRTPFLPGGYGFKAAGAVKGAPGLRRGAANP